MNNITNVINNLSQLDYESLTGQECVELMEEIEKLNTIIKQKLTNALLRNSRRYRPFYEIESYSIETTPQRFGITVLMTHTDLQGRTILATIVQKMIRLMAYYLAIFKGSLII